MTGRLLWLVTALIHLASATASANEAARVVLLEPAAPDALSVEVFARLRGELSAGGFEVIVVPVSPDAEPRTALEQTGRELGPAAVVILQRSVDAASGDQIAELWISDLLLQRTLIQRARVTPDKPSRDIARLAVQVAELLKARVAELSVDGERRSRVTQAPPAEAEPLRAPEPRTRAAVLSTWALGAGVLQRFEQARPTFTPLIRVGVAFPGLLAPALTLELRGSAAALGEIRESASQNGAAKWRQSFATAEIVARFFPNSPVEPLLSLSSGVYLLEVAGQAQSPYRARGDTTWSALSGVGGGLWVELGSSLAWVADAQIMAAWSKTSVRVNRREVWSSGSPIVFASTSLVATF